MPSGIYKRTEKHLEHLRELTKKLKVLNKGRKHSEESKKKMSIAVTGRKRDEKTKRRLSEIRRLRPSDVLGKHWKLKPEVIEKRKGENSPVWKGGISKNLSHYMKERRARELGAGGSHTFTEWQTLKVQYNWTCPCCHKSEPEIKLSEDHIIPLSKGGSNNIENIQPLCRSCNSKKYNKIIKKYETK